MNSPDHPIPATPAPGSDGPAPRLGDYVVGARLERRPAADVYEATHSASGAPRLVYVLRPGAMQNAAFVHRLAHEIDAARWLRHAAVAKVDPCAETANGRLYVAVERPAGRSLAGVLAEGARMSAGRVVRLGSRLVEALDEAHAVGLAHGRLTPASVVVADGWDEGAQALVTLTGLGVGVVAHDDVVVGVDRAYVSPEQRAGAEPTARSDVFGLAALLHHALFGAPPAEVDGADGVTVDAVEHLPAAVVLAAARAADPACRPASVKAFWEDLLDALVSEAGSEAPHDAPRGAALSTPAVPGPAAPAAPGVDGAVGPGAGTVAAPPSVTAPTRRRPRAVWMHGLWLAVPLGAAAALAWPGAKSRAHAAAPTAPTAPTAPAAATAAVAAPAQPAGAAPAAAVPAGAPAPTAVATAPADSAATRDARPARDARHGAEEAKGSGETHVAASEPASTPKEPAHEGASVAPGVSVPTILLVAPDAPRPARSVTRPDDFSERLAPRSGGNQ